MHLSLIATLLAATAAAVPTTTRRDDTADYTPRYADWCGLYDIPVEQRSSSPITKAQIEAGGIAKVAAGDGGCYSLSGSNEDRTFDMQHGNVVCQGCRFYT
jgi:hypothetical protein